MLKLNTLSGFGSGVSAAGGASPTYGYFGSGITSGSSTATDRITFATSTLAAHTDADQSYGAEADGDCSDAGSFGYGYFVAGYSSENVATTDRITFSTSTTAAHTDANTYIARSPFSGNSDGTTYGYITESGLGVADADRITFSTSVAAQNTDANLATTRRNTGSLSDGPTYGYTIGGIT